MHRFLRTVSALVTTALLSATTAVFAAATVDDYPMQPQRVADGVYAVITPTRDLPNPDNKGWNSNSAFVVTDNGVLVFDTGSSEVIGQALRRAIARTTDQPVRWVVDSHGHGDHWLGNAAFPDAEIIATIQVADRIRAEGEDWVRNFNNMTEGATGESTIVPPTSTVDQRTSRTLGGTEVMFIPSGNSHSPGDLMVWLPKRGVLLTGDVLYSDRMPSTFDADVRRWIAQLDEFQALEPAPTVVVPGHGEVSDLSGVRRLRALLSDFWQAVRSGYEAGKQGFEMVPDVQQALAEYREAYPGLDEKVQRDIGRVYLQVEAAAFE